MLRWTLVGVLVMAIGCGAEPFSSAKWRTQPETRAGMVDELLESKRLIGLSRVEVEALLGPPGRISMTEFDGRTMDTFRIGPVQCSIGEGTEPVLIVTFHGGYAVSTRVVNDEWYYDVGG